jgi:DNA-binding response OmpR family regulator
MSILLLSKFSAGLPINYTVVVRLHTVSLAPMTSDELIRDLAVLVVDDEPMVRELLLEYFGALGFRVTGAEDGRSAIATLQRGWGRYGLVVTDLNLPGADGFAVLQAARQSNPQCFVVIITGYASLDSAIRAVRVGAYDYLTKPFSLGQLDIILTRIRDRRAQRLGQPAPATMVPTVIGRRPEIVVDGRREVEESAVVPIASLQTLPPALAPTVPADPPVVVANAEIVAPPVPYNTMASYNVAQRLGLLEAAFGRIEALLREKR